MELQQLRYFDEVARTQHVTNSAKKLNVAQPALTQSIRRLERELGVTLFERVGRNVRLTACGDALQKRVAGWSARGGGRGGAPRFIGASRRCWRPSTSCPRSLPW